MRSRPLLCDPVSDPRVRFVDTDRLPTSAATLARLNRIGASLGTQERLEEARASELWPTVAGEVVETWMGRNLSAHVRYRHTVAGVEYVSDRIRLAEKFWRDPRSEIVARYTEGRRVGVAYDPSDPSRAVLEPGAGWGAVAKKMVGGLVLGVSSFGLIWVGVFGLRR